MKKEEVSIDLQDMSTEDFKKKVTGFSQETYTELKARYGNRLSHLHIKVDEEESYDYLLLRPSKNIILAMTHQREDINAVNDILISNCVVAGSKEALEDGVVYTAVMEAIGGLLKTQASFIKKA